MVLYANLFFGWVLSVESLHKNQKSKALARILKRYNQTTWEEVDLKDFASIFRRLKLAQLFRAPDLEEDTRRVVLNTMDYNPLQVLCVVGGSVREREREGKREGGRERREREKGGRERAKERKRAREKERDEGGRDGVRGQGGGREEGRRGGSGRLVGGERRGTHTHTQNMCAGLCETDKEQGRELAEEREDVCTYVCVCVRTFAFVYLLFFCVCVCVQQL